MTTTDIRYGTDTRSEARDKPRTPTRSLGITIPDTDGPTNLLYYRAILAARQATRDRGFGCRIFNEQDMLAFAGNRRSVIPADLAGMIVFAPCLPWEDYVRRLLQDDIPVVLLRRSMTAPGVFTINNDDYDAGWKMMQHLHGLGHTSIAYLSVGHNDRKAPDRSRAYREYLRGFGSAGADGSLEIRLSLYTDPLMEHLARLRAAATAPTAVYCFSDHVAALAVNTIKKTGLRIPDDIAVTGFNNSAIAVQLFPALTTVHVPVEQMIARACKGLCGPREPGERLGGSIMFSNRLIIRESTIGTGNTTSR